MVEVLLGLGSNLDDRAASLTSAVERLRQYPDIDVVRVSGWRETRAVGGPPDQSAFLNGAALVETSLAPTALLAELQRIENELGRVRKQHWGPRTIDLDVLLYGLKRVKTPELSIPHPRMAWRRFVLETAAEIAPQKRHPILRWTVQQLWERLQLKPLYLAISSFRNWSTPELAGKVAEMRGGRALHASIPEWARKSRSEQIDAEAQRMLQECQRTLIESLNNAYREPSHDLLVSSYWIEDFVPNRATGITSPERMVETQEFSDEPPQPTLVALIDPQDATEEEQWLRRSLKQDDIVALGEFNALMRERLYRRALRPWGVPIVTIASNEMDRQCAELVAAIDEMQC